MSYDETAARADSCLLMATCLMANIEENGGLGQSEDSELDKRLATYYQHLNRMKVARNTCIESLDLSSSIFEVSNDFKETKGN